MSRLSDDQLREIFQSPTLGLNAVVPVIKMLQLKEHLAERERERQRLEAEIERLKEALTPFAAAANRWNDPPHALTHDNVQLWQRGQHRINYLTVGDLRRARAALGREGGSPHA